VHAAADGAGVAPRALGAEGVEVGVVAERRDVGDAPVDRGEVDSAHQLHVLVRRREVPADAAVLLTLDSRRSGVLAGLSVLLVR